MPFVFIVVGIGFVVIAIRGTQATAFQLLQSEFSGANSFIKWALAIFILGALGYIQTIRPVTRALLALVLLVIFLVNGKGLFAQFNAQIAHPTAPTGNVTIDPLNAINPETGQSLPVVGQGGTGGLNLGQYASGGLTLGSQLSGGGGSSSGLSGLTSLFGSGGGSGGLGASGAAGFITA